LTLALAKRPRLLLLDEPAAALDPLARRSFLTSIAHEAREHGITVVHSSHDIGELDRACDFLAIVKDGGVVVAGPIADLVRAGETLEDLILATLAGDAATRWAA
jgi:ABC-2 type transport system ATP-binding protein